MSQFARVESVEALQEFRVSLCKFAEAVQTGLVEADAEISRAGHWLRQDRDLYWKAEARKRAELLNRAKIALSQKKHTKTPLGGRPSCVEEEKAFAVAQRRYEEAQTKLASIKRWSRQLDEETFQYRGQVQGLTQAIDSDVPNALARLDRMMEALEHYLAATAAPSEAAPAEQATATSRWGEAELPSIARDTPEEEDPATRGRPPRQVNADAEKDEGAGRVSEPRP